MEVFRPSMNYLLDLGFTIQVLATDRHVQIRSIMSKEYSSTDLQFDVWNLSNNIKKEKGKGCEELGLVLRRSAIIYGGVPATATKTGLAGRELKICCSPCSGSVYIHWEHITQCHHEPLDPEAVGKLRARLGSRKTDLSLAPPPPVFNTDRSKAVLLLWFLTCSCCPYLYFGSAIM